MNRSINIYLLHLFTLSGENMENPTNSQDKIELKNEERTACEIWTRVMGYFRPQTSFNKGKRSECSERICFTEEKYESKDNK